MKTSSAKQKGRSLQKWVSDQISKITGIQNGKDELIASIYFNRVVVNTLVSN